MATKNTMSKVITSRRTLNALREIARQEARSERSFLAAKQRRARNEFMEYACGEDTLPQDRTAVHYMGVR